jgi:hypothetical protein
MGIFDKIKGAVKSAVKFVGNAPKKIAKGAQKLVTDPADWAKNALKSGIQAAPVLALPGVGGLVSGALGGLGLGGVAGAAKGALGAIGKTASNVLGKIPGGGIIKSGVQAIGKSPVGQGVRQALGGQPLTIKNLMGGGAPAGGLQPTGGGGGIGGWIRDNVLGGKPITLGNVLGKGGDIIKSGVKTVKEHPELALAAANAVYGAGRAKGADELRKKGVSTAEGSWNTRAPLREAGVKGMLNTTRPDLASTFNDPTNPFAPGATPRPMPSFAPPMRPKLPAPMPLRPPVGMAPAAPVQETPPARDPAVLRAMLEEGLKRRKPVRGGKLQAAMV